MKLYTSMTSPFGRKVKLAAAIKGIADRIETVIADTNPPGNAELIANNPLGKIPVLVLDDGTRLYDSRVICEAIDAMGAAGAPALMPSSGLQRWQTLTRAALADGIADAGILIFYESRFRSPEHHNAGWVARQQAKIDAGLDHLESSMSPLAASPDYADLSLAAALGHLDFRHDGRWRQGRPRIVAWLDQFARAVPAYADTAPVA